MHKYFLFFLFSFLLGFLVHAFFFADLLPNRIIALTKQGVGIKDSGAEPTLPFANSTVFVDYKDGKFIPSSVVSKKGNRLVITNKMTDEQMWLVSDSREIETVRGYQESEALSVVFTQPGTFVVNNKLNSKHTLIVTVKP